MAVVGKRVALARTVASNAISEHLVTAIEDRVWLKAGELEWRQTLEEPDDVRLASAGLKLWYVGHWYRRLPLDGVSSMVRSVETPPRPNASEIARTVFTLLTSGSSVFVRPPVDRSLYCVTNSRPTSVKRPAQRGS
jgi:hypothetical protein